MTPCSDLDHRSGLSLNRLSIHHTTVHVTCCADPGVGLARWFTPQFDGHGAPGGVHHTIGVSVCKSAHHIYTAHSWEALMRRPQDPLLYCALSLLPRLGISS